MVYDNGVVRTYVNGNSQPVDTFNGAGSISNASCARRRRLPGTAEWFTGSLDEVRLFNRALTADEINALYTGSGPLLVLPFEKPWATDGEACPTASGWGHDGTLETGEATPRTRRHPGRSAPTPSSSTG